MKKNTPMNMKWRNPLVYMGMGQNQVPKLWMVNTKLD